MGSFLLNPACVLLLPFGSQTAGSMLLVCACAYLCAAASLDLIFVLHHQKQDHNSLQKCHAMLMWVGSALFLLASVLYLPSVRNILIGGLPSIFLGTWMFRGGSFFYLGASSITLHLLQIPTSPPKIFPDEESKYSSDSSLVSQEDSYFFTGTARLLNVGDKAEDSIYESRPVRLSTKTIWLYVIGNYIAGSVFYLTGGVLSQVYDAHLAADVMWCIGSFLFSVGAFLQLFEVVRSWSDLKDDGVERHL